LASTWTRPWRGKKNVERVAIRHNDISFARLPAEFDGFTILHISDMHIDMNQGAMKRLAELVPDMSYDICALTGDFRGAMFGPFDAALEGLAQVRAGINGPVFAVLYRFHNSLNRRPAVSRHRVSE
jgi:predicted MPP superfamily phosphohydrolase